MNGPDDKMVDALYSAWLEQSRQKATALEPAVLAPLFCQCEKFYLLRVTAVLTARNDGSQALGEVVNGQIVPAVPYLRDPVKHTEPGSSYVTDWLKLANVQLLRSGACFGFDVTGIQYVLELNDALHSRECGDGKGQQTADFIQDQIAAGNSAYKDRVIIIFRWGSHPTKQTGSGCSSATAMNILMPGTYQEWAWLDGKAKFGNNLMTHEFGHFMGLDHTFPWLANKRLGPLVTQDNQYLYPLHKDNLPYMTGVTEADLLARRQEGLDYIATWGYSLEQDTGGNDKAGIPAQYGIKDTPVDLGVALSLLMGDSACEDIHNYQLDRYKGSDLVKGKDADDLDIWTPKAGTAPSFVDTVTVEDGVRRNVMSYWRCDKEGQLFTSDQVERMHFVLLNSRASLIGKTLTWSAPCWILQLPWWLKKNVPWENPTQLVLALWFFVLRLAAPRAWDGWRVFTGNIVQPAYRWDAGLYRRYLTELERSGRLQEVVENSFKPQACGVTEEALPSRRE